MKSTLRRRPSSVDGSTLDGRHSGRLLFEATVLWSTGPFVEPCGPAWRVRFTVGMSLLAYASVWPSNLHNTLVLLMISCQAHLAAQEESSAPRYPGVIRKQWYLLQHALAKGLPHYYKYFQTSRNRGTHTKTQLWHSRVERNTNLTIGGSLAGTTPVLPFGGSFLLCRSIRNA